MSEISGMIVYIRQLSKTYILQTFKCLPKASNDGHTPDSYGKLYIFSVFFQIFFFGKVMVKNCIVPLKTFEK